MYGFAALLTFVYAASHILAIAALLRMFNGGLYIEEDLANLFVFGAIAVKFDCALWVIWTLPS